METNTKVKTLTRIIGDWTFIAKTKNDDYHGNYVEVECFIRKLNGSKSNWKSIAFYESCKSKKLIEYIFRATAFMTV